MVVFIIVGQNVFNVGGQKGSSSRGKLWWQKTQAVLSSHEGKSCKIKGATSNSALCKIREKTIGKLQDRDFVKDLSGADSSSEKVWFRKRLFSPSGHRFGVEVVGGPLLPLGTLGFSFYSCPSSFQLCSALCLYSADTDFKYMYFFISYHQENLYSNFLLS